MNVNSRTREYKEGWTGRRRTYVCRKCGEKFQVDTAGSLSEDMRICERCKNGNETRLIEWNRIKSEIANCSDIVEMGKLNYSLEAIQKWARQSKQSFETQNEIAIYRARLNRKQGEWINENIPETGTFHGNQYGSTNFGRPTLAELGIDKHDSPKFRTLANIPGDRFENILTELKEDTEITTNEICRKWDKTIATKWTGDQENYTPELYIEAARTVMGSIDCDPASNEFAQQVVKAKTYFTKETNGLSQSWQGNIFLNPPYSHPEVSLFVEKLLSELKGGQQAILLTNNNTDTGFFHKAAQRASIICLTRGRIHFYKSDGEKRTQPTNGQVFFYFGNEVEKFANIFSEFGLLVICYGDRIS